MDDKELREHLAQGPLARNGFDEALRRRIHEQIDNPRRRTRRIWAPMARIGGVFAVLFAVLAGAWIWQAQSNGDSASERMMVETALDAAPAASAQTALTTEPPRSAMLIGLRKDVPSRETSTYRTVLVTPEDGELRVSASLEGIYMPYKLKFYRLDAVGDSGGRGSQTLASVPAGETLPVAIATDPAYVTNEKLLFAGNKYVSLLQTQSDPDTGESTSRVWVKDVEQLAPALRENAVKSREEPHYELTQLVQLSSLRTDEWTIARQSGQWVVKVPGTAESSEQMLNRISNSTGIGPKLPTEVASYDKLWLNWEDIRAKEPAAIDAYTSPTEDLLAVQTADALSIAAYRMKEEDMKPLTIKLEHGENIVMVQWAQDGYVNNWKTMLGQWIGTTNHY
ncbi:hypothetical protein [Cohnella panacarvi]|uniref:hypothetical protein n=1 Tax=Cohnella panacarvi TaxID=400776 RepID=UPI00047DEE31|nr:hypothetical protein [Cohnella panacarvi]